MRGGIRILNVPARGSGGERLYSAVSPVDAINIKAALMYFSFDNENRLRVFILSFVGIDLKG